LKEFGFASLKKVEAKPVEAKTEVKGSEVKPPAGGL
jgi:hypothetical protein